MPTIYNERYSRVGRGYFTDASYFSKITPENLPKFAVEEAYLMKQDIVKEAKGSVELIVMGLLAALIIVLAIPILADIGTKTEENLQAVNEQM